MHTRLGLYWKVNDIGALNSRHYLTTMDTQQTSALSSLSGEMRYRQFMYYLLSSYLAGQERVAVGDLSLFVSLVARVTVGRMSQNLNCFR